jgi:hypothetical protein
MCLGRVPNEAWWRRTVEIWYGHFVLRSTNIFPYREFYVRKDFYVNVLGRWEAWLPEKKADNRCFGDFLKTCCGG